MSQAMTPTTKFIHKIDFCAGRTAATACDLSQIHYPRVSIALPGLGILGTSYSRVLRQALYTSIERKCRRERRESSEPN